MIVSEIIFKTQNTDSFQISNIFVGVYNINWKEVIGEWLGELFAAFTEK